MTGLAFPGALAEDAKACGLHYWLVLRRGRKKFYSTTNALLEADRISNLLLTDSGWDPAVAYYNILESPYPVHYPIPADNITSCLEALLTHVSSTSGSELARLSDVAADILKFQHPCCAIRGSSSSASFSRRIRPIEGQLSALLRAERLASHTPAGPAPKMLIKCATLEELAELSAAPAGEVTGTTASSSSSFGGNVCSFARSTVQRLAATSTTLQRHISTYGLGRLVRAAEQLLVHGLCGAVTLGRAAEGSSASHPFTVGYSKSGSSGGASRAAGASRPYTSGVMTRSVSVEGLRTVSRRLTAGQLLAKFEESLSKSALRAALLGKFPRKPHPQAGAKCNIYLDCLLSDVRECRAGIAPSIFRLLASLPSGYYSEDQICNAVLHSCCLTHPDTSLKLLVFILYGLLSPDALKGLSNVLKGTGTNMIIDWAPFVELHCLLGRGVGSGDLEADARRRVSEERGCEVEVDIDRLEATVGDILSEELDGRVVTVDSLDRHWDRRFEWCVAGAHSHTINSPDLPEVPREGPGGVAMTRRMAMEYVDRNPVVGWDGTTRVSVVEKLEQGKTRAIYSCSTTNYIAFSRVLRPVERAWRGRNVIVDPGAGGNYGMFRRIRNAWPKALPVALMLDYADFNSQHTLAAQQTVIKSLISRTTGVSATEEAQLLESFDRMHLHLKGRPMGRVRRTLMSGHRGTSFINSVLNSAYLRLVIGPERYAKVQSFHVGDDVLIFCRTASEAYGILGDMRSAGFGLQASKQSVGVAGYEFLRMAGTRQSAHGYLARAVASCVSGNWTNDWKMAPAAALHSLVQMSRSIINRSRNVEAWRLMLSSTCAATNLPREIVGEVLSGQVAVGSGPVFREDGRYECREILEAPDGCYASIARHDEKRLPRYASRAYFERGCTPLEHKAMDLAGFVPWGAALRSTYGDLATPAAALSDAPAPAPRAPVCLGGRTLFAKAGEVLLDHELDKPVQRGVLAQYPVIALLQNVLDDGQLGELMRSAGYSFEPGSERINAFGGVREGAVIRGWLPYADAAALGTRALTGSVRVMHPLYM